MIWDEIEHSARICTLSVQIWHYFTIIKFNYFQVQKTSSIFSFHFIGKLNSWVIVIESIYNCLQLIQRYTKEDERKKKKEGVLEGCLLFSFLFLFVFSWLFNWGVVILVQIWSCFLCFEDSSGFEFLKFLIMLLLGR